MAKKTATAEIYLSEADNQWRWRVRAKNGEIVIPNEGHKDSRGPARAFRTIKGMFERGEIEGPVLVDSPEVSK